MITSPYSIRPFQKEDIQAVIGREKEVIEMFGIDGLAEAYSKGPAFTGLFHGEPFGMAGVVILWPGLGEAWALMSPGYRKHAFFIHKEVLRHLKWIALKYNLRRIQAAADAGNYIACKWLGGEGKTKGLGFTNEGPMPEYCNGRTFIRYARIFKPEDSCPEG